MSEGQRTENSHYHEWQFAGGIGYVDGAKVSSTEWVCIKCNETRYTEDGKAPSDKCESPDKQG